MKHPVFCISAKKLEDLIRETVDRLAEAGLDVRVVICDQGATNKQIVCRQLRHLS